MQQFIYIYRMTCDTGCAPCVYDKGYITTDMLTLACCKGGQIRKKKGVNTGLRYTIGSKHQEGIKNKTEDVYVIGVMKNRLVYIAQITDVCEMKDYFADDKYKRRLDSIYNYSETPKTSCGKQFYFIRNNNNPNFHPEGECGLHKRDELGRFVLISKSFAYFGKQFNAKINNEKYNSILPKRQETKLYFFGQYGFDIAIELINEYWNNNICIVSNEPTERIAENSSGCKQK